MNNKKKTNNKSKIRNSIDLIESVIDSELTLEEFTRVQSLCYGAIDCSEALTSSTEELLNLYVESEGEMRLAHERIVTEINNMLQLHARYLNAIKQLQLKQFIQQN